MVSSEPDEWTDDDHGAYARDGSGGPVERSVSGSDGLYLYLRRSAPALCRCTKSPKNAISAGH